MKHARTACDQEFPLSDSKGTWDQSRLTTEGRADSAAEKHRGFELLQSYYGGDRGCLRRGAREEQRGAVVILVGGAGLGVGGWVGAPLRSEKTVVRTLL